MDPVPWWFARNRSGGLCQPIPAIPSAGPAQALPLDPVQICCYLETETSRIALAVRDENESASREALSRKVLL